MKFASIDEFVERWNATIDAAREARIGHWSPGGYYTGAPLDRWRTFCDQWPTIVFCR